MKNLNFLWENRSVYHRFDQQHTRIRPGSLLRLHIVAVVRTKASVSDSSHVVERTEHNPPHPRVYSNYHEEDDYEDHRNGFERQAIITCNNHSNRNKKV